MATTRLTDLFLPELFASYTSNNSVEKTALVESGVVAFNNELDALAAAGSLTLTVPFWNDLDASVEPNYTTDNPADVAVPQKIDTGEMIGRVAYLNEGFSSADLNKELSGNEDPMQAIRDRIDRYWARQFQRRVIATAVGVFNHNVATDAGDMVRDVSSTTPGTIVAANRWSRAAFVDAVFTLGDAGVDLVGAIAVHSTIYKAMVNADDIDFIPDSQGNLTIPTFLGKRVIVDDGAPTSGAGVDRKYICLIFGVGAFGWGDGNPRVPEEVEREASQGNGGGVETLWTRRTWVIHPAGHSFVAAGGGALAGQSPTWAELQTAAKWDRVFSRKAVPLAYLVVNA